MLTLRQQTHVEFEDLSLEFRLEAIHIWAEFGIAAGRCYALGA